MNSANTALTQGTYVVTHDVASRLQSFRSRDITVPRQDDPIFARFHKCLFEKMRRALPEMAIKTIDMGELRLKVRKEVESRLIDSSKQVVISTCPEITDPNPDGENLTLNINRLFNTNGVMIGHGPRPGFDPLDKQFDELARKITGRCTILIKDGAFTGGTFRFVNNELNVRGIDVTTVIIGFCCTRAKETIKQAFNGEIVIVNPVENLIDWIPDHDLIPFVHNCGRILGEQVPKGFMPVKTVDGFSYAYPYILPFGKIEEWASLPVGNALDLSRFCLDMSIELFARVTRLDGRRITIGELLESNPRVSIPVEIGKNREIPALDTGIVAYLEYVRKRLE